MPTNIRGRAPGLGTQLVGLLAAIRWEAQFKLAKCCMHASKSISDLGVFFAEPVLERSKALNRRRGTVAGECPQLTQVAVFPHFTQSSSASRFTAGA